MSSSNIRLLGHATSLIFSIDFCTFVESLCQKKMLLFAVFSTCIICSQASKLCAILSSACDSHYVP